MRQWLKDEDRWLWWLLCSLLSVLGSYLYQRLVDGVRFKERIAK